MSPEITKIIEQYLDNGLSAADRAAFERRLETSEILRNELGLQKSVREASKRAAQRSMVKQVARRYHFRKNALTAGIVAVIAAIIAAAVMFAIFKAGESGSPVTQKELAALSEKLGKLAPIENVPSEYFVLEQADTIVFSGSGVLLSVPSGAFLLDGKNYDGAKVVQWQEARDAAAIIKGGLSTMSGDRLLETQGMFGFKAFTPEGKQLTVNPKIGVYVQVPVNELKDGMQLFEGKPGANGVIDWQDPRPLEKNPCLQICAISTSIRPDTGRSWISRAGRKRRSRGTNCISASMSRKVWSIMSYRIR
jgi:hypothetical protein